MWKDLMRVLNDLVKKYEALVRVGEKKHKALVAVDMKTLERLLDEEKQLAADIEALEHRRQQTCIALATHHSEIRKDTKMEEAVRLAPADFQRVLTALHASLSKVADRAKELGEENDVLAHGALQAVQYHLNRLGGTQVDPTYGPRGTEHETRVRKIQYDA